MSDQFPAPISKPDAALSRCSLVLALVAPVLWLALVGVVGAYVWTLVWTPPVAYSEDLSSIGTFIVVSLGAGLVAGVVIGLATRSRHLVVLLVTVPGAAASTATITRLGEHWGPRTVDPQALRVPMTFDGSTPYAVFSLACLGAMTLIWMIQSLAWKG